MSGAIEMGVCPKCGKISSMRREYYHYGFPCDCHSPEHFEMVRVCDECALEEPQYTTPKITTALARWFGEVYSLLFGIPMERIRTIAKAEQEGRAVILPFKSDGIAMIYAGAFKVTNVEEMGDEPLKAVVFRVTQEESDRYDAEAARIINERQTL